MNVTALRQPQAAPAMATAPHGAAAKALNTLWFRLDRARAVAACIPAQCDAAWEQDGAVAALAQATSLAGAISERKGRGILS